MSKKWRFYRHTLPTIVWNPETDSPLAEFVNGQFTTEDESIAKVLAGMGYPEVALDAKYPPDIMPEPVPIVTPDVDLKSLPKTEGQAAKQAETGGLEEDQDNTGQEASPTKRKIKRRKK